MIIAKIPSKIEISSISELSPSKYTWLKDGCAYSFVLESALRSYGRPSLLMPPATTKNVIGTIIHKIFQLVYSGHLSATEEAITAKWKELCDFHRNEIREAFPTLGNVQVVDYDKMYETIDVVLDTFQESHTVPGGDYVGIRNPNEHYIKLDGLLRGSIDRIRYASGAYEIVDYKTGKVYDDNGDIKKDYIDQLNLYAYMLEEKEGVTVSKLTIIDHLGNEIDAPYDRNAKNNVFNSIKCLISEINNAIASGAPTTLAKPSEQNCCFCPCLHLCEKRICSSNDTFQILEGKVMKVLNNDQLLIMDDDGNQIIIAKLNPLNLDGFDSLENKTLIFVNLLKIQDNVLYNKCDKTVIYERL